MRLCSTLALVGVFAGSLASSAIAQLPPAPAPLGNPTTLAKSVVGKILFFDEQLSSDNNMACATCHIANAGGVDPRSGSVGSIHPGLDATLGTPDDIIGSPGVRTTTPGGFYLPDPTFGFANKVTDRQSMSHIGAGHFIETFWDGRGSTNFTDPMSGVVTGPGAGLESQAIGPILSSTEMARPGRTWGNVVNKLNVVSPLALAWALTPDVTAAIAANPTYPLLFQWAFGGAAVVNSERIAFALASYMRTQNPDSTPWDRWIAGDPTAMTATEVNGWNDFNAGGCAGCHAPPLFSDRVFHRLGLRPPVEDMGRFNVTFAPPDVASFKSASLRNVGLRKHFFHNGEQTITSINGVLNFYNGGGGAFGPSPGLAAIALTPTMIANIDAFLTNGLTDPRVAAEAPPFHRPRLHSERPVPNPELWGGSVAGSGGFVPKGIAEVPPKIGTPEFRLGLFDALAGATAFVYASPTDPGFAGAGGTWAVVAGPIILAGPSPTPGAGHATWANPIPPNPALIGTEVWFQWRIIDAAASAGVSRSEVVHVTYF